MLEKILKQKNDKGDNKAANSKTPATKPAKDQPSEAELTAIDTLSYAEPYHVLALLMPRLVWERNDRIKEIDEELADIDKRLGELYKRKNDIFATTPTPAKDKEAVAAA